MPLLTLTLKIEGKATRSASPVFGFRKLKLKLWWSELFSERAFRIFVHFYLRSAFHEGIPMALSNRLGSRTRIHQQLTIRES